MFDVPGGVYPHQSSHNVGMSSQELYFIHVVGDVLVLGRPLRRIPATGLGVRCELGKEPPKHLLLQRRAKCDRIELGERPPRQDDTGDGYS